MRDIAFILIVLVMAAYIYYLQIEKLKEKVKHYYITVKFIGGNKTKLTLDEEKYIKFEGWVNQAEGVYNLKDDSKAITLIRQHVASVEVVKK